MIDTPQRRLAALFKLTCDRLGIPHLPIIEKTSEEAGEWYVVGRGVFAVLPAYWGQTYLAIAFPPGDRAGHRLALRLFRQALTRHGTLTAVVHPRNLPSVKLVTKLGGIPAGVDSDGFIHYDFTRDGKTHAEASEAARSHPDL